MAQSTPSSSKGKDSPTHAPESGEPTEMVRPSTTRGSEKSASGHSEKSQPGKGKVGEDFESGRRDAKP